MREVEVKILEIDVELYQKKILELGGKKIYEGDLKAVYFKGEGLDDKLLRIRTDSITNYITFKINSSKGATKSSDELETTVGDYNMMIKIIQGLGYEPHKPINKHRISYKLDDAQIEFDTLPGIPTFMEIEAEDDNTVFAIADKLVISKDDCKAWTGVDVIKHYKKEKELL